MEYRQPRRLRRIRQELKGTAAVWRVPGIAGVIGFMAFSS